MKAWHLPREEASPSGGKKGHLQVPDLDLGVHGSCPKNESIRVELRTGESCKEREMDVWSEAPGRDRTQQGGSSFFAFLAVPSTMPGTQQVLAANVFLEEQPSK